MHNLIQRDLFNIYLSDSIFNISDSIFYLRSIYLKDSWLIVITEQQKTSILIYQSFYWQYFL